MNPISQKSKIQFKLLRWFDKNKRDLPWRKTKDPYAIWVSEIMLQQTQVATVIPYYQKFLKSFPTLRHLAKANLSKVLKIWEGLGYYSRARNLHRSSRIVLNHFHGKIPDTLEDLLSLAWDRSIHSRGHPLLRLLQRSAHPRWECEKSLLQALCCFRKSGRNKNGTTPLENFRISDSNRIFESL